MNVSCSANGSLVINLGSTNGYSYDVTTQPSHGSATISGGTLTYTPTPGYTGGDTFAYRQVNTTTGLVVGGATYDVSVTLPSAFAAASNFSISKNRTTTVTDGIGGNDYQFDPLTFAVASQPAHGSVSVSFSRQSGGISYGSFTYTPTNEYVGSDSFTFTVSDAWGTSTPATVNLSVAAPYGWNLPSGYATVSGGTLDMQGTNVLLLRSADPQGDARGIFLWRAPEHGTISIDSLGRFIYKAEYNYSGTDTFQWVVADAWGASTPVTETITVYGWNFSPNFQISSNSIFISLDGLPNHEYIIEGSEDLQNWQELQRIATDSLGRIRQSIGVPGISTKARFMIRTKSTTLAVRG